MLLEHDRPFNFDENCLKAFIELKKAPVTAPIVVAPDQGMCFKFICNAGDHSIGEVVGQRKSKIFHSIYQASKTLANSHNYTTIEKELLVFAFTFDKFKAYLVGTKVTVCTDHSTIKYLISNKDATLRFIYWIFLLQEFDLRIKDRKDTENQVANYLSRLEPDASTLTKQDIT